MRVRVIETKCQGHGMCTLACAEIFVLDGDTGHASVTSELVPEALEPAVLAAQSTCPEGAIEIK